MNGVWASANGVVLECIVAPRAKTTRFVGMHGGRIKVALAAPPVDGKANEELLRFFAELLSVPQRQVELSRGASSKIKILEIQGVTPEQVISALENDCKRA